MKRQQLEELYQRAPQKFHWYRDLNGNRPKIYLATPYFHYSGSLENFHQDPEYKSGEFRQVVCYFVVWIPLKGFRAKRSKAQHSSYSEEYRQE